MPRWLVVLIEVVLVVVCGATALIGVLATVGCLNEGQLTELAVCKSPADQSVYLVALGTAAGIALIGVLFGHIKRRWWIVLTAVGLSLTVAIIAMVWGLRYVPVPPQ